jgi:hypothetical protein
MALMLSVGLAEVVLHLRAIPSPGPYVEIRPNAPIVEPASPEESRSLMTLGATPVRLVGAPNYYVVPAAGPTILWHHDVQRNKLVAADILPPFSSVQALRLFRQNGLVEVRVTNVVNGYVEATRLSPGDAAAARRAYCAYNAGPSPTNGEILERHSDGVGHLDLENHASEPAVVKLRDQDGSVSVSVFLAPGGHVYLSGLPDLPTRADFAIGEFWSRTCRSFAAGMRAQRVTAFLSLDALTPLAIPPDLPGKAAIVDIPDQAFEQE